MDHVGPHVTRPGPVTPDNCSRNVVLDVDSTSECVDGMVTDDPETKRPVVKCATVEVKSEVTNGKHVFRKAIKPLDLNSEETKPLIGSINGISRPKSIVKTPSVQSFGVPAAKSPSKNDSFQNYPKGIVKSDSGEDKPVLRVQFHNGVAVSSPPQSPIPDSEIPASPCGSLSSSSSGSSDDSIGNFSEARPPDGGWGWVVVIASFMVNLIADGITFSFSVLYVEFLDYFGEGKAKTAWIGSLFMAMPLLSGPIASFLTDRYGCRRVCIAGSILASVGFIISSFAESMMVVIITFGVIAGFGLSLCYVAAVVIVAYYFDKRRSFATGLSVCGSGIGTFIFAPVIDFLIVEYGWRGTVLILAGMFLNMAVCGALMRDLAWTTNRAKAKAKDRKRARKEQRNKNNGSSGDSFTASNSTNTAGTASQLQPLAELDHMDDNSGADESRLFSSLVNLPTFVRNGEKVPLEVLELLSTHRNVYNVLLQNYPSLLISSRSFSDSGRLNEQAPVSHRFTPAQSPLAQEPAQSTVPAASPTCNTDAAYLWWLKKTQPNPQERSTHHSHRRLQTAYLKDLRMHRHSLTYRGAMLNINRYRLRASSCPDIYRNSMTTIAKEKYNWYDGLWEFWDLLVDMLDFSHFSDPRFLLFALSNFLLYLWYDMPYVFFTDNAKEMGFTQTDGSLLISVIGIFNMVGEIFLGWAGDCAWVNARGVYALCMLLCGITMALVPLLSSYMALCILSGAFGLFIAANYSLTSIILVELITLERFTNAYGLLLLVQGVANLVGPPLAGWIYDITLTYDLSFYLAGFFIAMSGAVLIIIPAMGRFKRHLVRLRNCSESTSPSHRSGSPTPAPPSGSPEKEVTFIRLPPNDNCNGNGRILNCFSSEEDLRHIKDPGINV